MKKTLMPLLILFAVMAMSGTANAKLTKIGTAVINSNATGQQGPGGGPSGPPGLTGNSTSNEYSLIYEDDQGLVWVDYSAPGSAWISQTNWASSLNAEGAITVKLDPGVSVSWEGEWRLPKTVDGGRTFGYDGTTTAGFNIATSELGHLYYKSLGNVGYYDTKGNQGTGWYPDSIWGLKNKGPFVNLKAANYWSGTEYSLLNTHAWAFSTSFGEQSNISFKGSYPYAGIAVRSAKVVFAD
jgi:hypothetical protein